MTIIMAIFLLGTRSRHKCQPSIIITEGNFCSEVAAKIEIKLDELDFQLNDVDVHIHPSCLQKHSILLRNQRIIHYPNISGTVRSDQVQIFLITQVIKIFIEYILMPLISFYEGNIYPRIEGRVFIRFKFRDLSL